ncbi:MAG: hypothetical protein PHC61_11855, partial [Chitinivibrionales bacterium]|nr:hypothetical protein [Chitinivibrionales bacterium]
AMQSAHELPLVSLWDACDDLQRVVVTEGRKQELAHGRQIDLDNADGAETAVAFDEERHCLAVLKKNEDGSYRPVRVLVR